VRFAVVLLVAAACGSKTPPPAVLGNTPADAGATTPPAAGCPATWADITPDGSCDPGVHRNQCIYPEGSCWCGQESPCTGVELPPEEYAAIPVAWQCTPTPPAVRADGCPGVEPAGACSPDGQACSYGDCCVTSYRCDRGQWSTGETSCPP
jgi:hypothetical protein